jgi:hypothetical protein
LAGDVLADNGKGGNAAQRFDAREKFQLLH